MLNLIHWLVDQIFTPLLIQVILLRAGDQTPDRDVLPLNPKRYKFPFHKMFSESTTLRRAKQKSFINSLKPKL